MPHTDLPHHHSPITQNHIDCMPKTEDFHIVADLFKILSDTSRIRIFWILCHYEECVINLSALMDMTSPAVSHHLKQLRSAGLITSRRDGKEVYYKAAQTEQTALLHNMIEKMMAISCPA